MPMIKSWANPLKCPEIDLVQKGQGTPTADRLLDYLFHPEVDRSCEAFVVRYREIAAIDDRLFIVPVEPTILGKLVWPLRQAKGCYALGNYIGCIALCGMVGEMVAVLLWDISKRMLEGKPLDDPQQRAIFGTTFEKLGQDRRTRVLLAFGVINNTTKTSFDTLREIRRKYLHFLSQSHEQLSSDARTAFENAMRVVGVVLGQRHTADGFMLGQEFMSYLVEKGIIEDDSEDGANKAR